MTLADELEQTGQDAARFRWLAANVCRAVNVFGDAWVATIAPEYLVAEVRRYVDAQRDTTVAPPGALYVES